MTDLEAIKKALNGFSPFAVEFTTESKEGNSIISPVDGYHGAYFTVIGCGDRQDDMGKLFALAVNSLPGLLHTLESLQRENEALKKDRYDLAYAITGGEDAPGLLDSVPTEDIVKIARDNHRRHSADIDRVVAAEAAVKRMRNKVDARTLTDKQLADEIEAIDEACKGGFGEGGGSPGEWWYERADELEHERKRRELGSQLQQHISRAALASTGGEHNGN